jgi:zinc transport system ATP-binding protein
MKEKKHEKMDGERKGSPHIVIDVHGLNFSFNGNTILRDINFTIQKNDFVGIIGPNGSGKTTLLKLLLGLYVLQSGSIKICGTSLPEFREWWRIGYVPQKATNIENSFPATVKEVVAMGLLSKKHFPKFLTSQDEEKIHKALSDVDMQSAAMERIGELSGGQQQRVFIARAIVTQPEILFLDEPTTGIDPESQKKFYEMLESLHKKGITIILITHDIGRITQYVTKIASLNQKLEFYGTHAQFCADDALHPGLKREHNICLHRG